jgi:hypothetical protein
MLALAAEGVVSLGDEVYQEAVRKFGDGFSISVLRDARRVMVTDRGLLEQVASGSLSLYKAFEMVTKGERVTCPTCRGEGHIFRPLAEARQRARPRRPPSGSVTDRARRRSAGASG